MTASTHYSDLVHVEAATARLRAAFGISWPTPPRESWLPWRGYSIHIDQWAASGEPRATVILVHGAGGHGRLLAGFAAPLAAAGFDVTAPDLPGYGLTRTDDRRAPAFAEWVDLVAELADQASVRGPVFLFGLSVGGILCVFAAQQARHVDGVIATTLIDLRDRETFLQCARTRWLGRLALAAFRWPQLGRLRVPMRLTMPIATLTTDAHLARMLVSDPLIGCRWVPLAFFRSLHQYRPRRSDYALACPLLLVHPGADAWTPIGMSLPIFERIAAPKKRVTLTNGAHAPFEAPAYAELCSAVTQFMAAELGACRA